MIRQYLLLADSKICLEAKEGMTVYKAAKHDYGCANDDTRHTGVQHISVTFKKDGDYPFFTHPLHLLQEVIDEQN